MGIKSLQTYMRIKIGVIFNIWIDSIEHLKTSVSLIKDEVDLFILVDQSISNRGESLRMDELNDYSHQMNQVLNSLKGKVISRHYVPDKKLPPRINEAKKRRIGLDIARKEGCTHYLHMDCDEYYPEFKRAKQMYFDSGKDGMACRMWTYFKKPTLRLKESEGYYVPFIHKIQEGTPRNYPVWADPTRTDVSKDILIVEEPLMHHMSFVRKDITRKLRNSSAPHDPLESNEYYQDYIRDLKEGDYIQCFKQHLIEVPNQFNINNL